MPQTKSGNIMIEMISFSDGAFDSDTVSRTLCPLDASHRPEKPLEQSFFVDVSTFSKQPLNFTLRAIKMESFEIRYIYIFIYTVLIVNEYTCFECIYTVNIEYVKAISNIN